MSSIEVNKEQIRQHNFDVNDLDDAIYLRLVFDDKVALLNLLNAYSSRDSKKAAGLTDDQCERVNNVIAALYL